MSPFKRSIAFTLGAVRVAVIAETRFPGRPARLYSDPSQTVAEPFTLSLTGETTRSGGQIADTLRKLNAAQDDSSDDVEALCDLWDRWHLNDLKAGTDRQTAALASYRAEIEAAGKSFDYADACGVLAMLGLHPDRGYRYGSAWLYEPIPDDVLAELVRLLDALDGAELGDQIDVDDAPELSGDMLDPDEVSQRLEVYRSAVKAYGIDPDSIREDSPDWPEDHDETRDEIVSEWINLRTAFDNITLSNVSTFIADDYFEEYTVDFAESCGMMKDEDKWPYNHIDWAAAADELKGDYSSTEYGGTTYWFRE